MRVNYLHNRVITLTIPKIDQTTVPEMPDPISLPPPYTSTLPLITATTFHSS